MILLLSPVPWGCIILLIHTREPCSLEVSLVLDKERENYTVKKFAFLRFSSVPRLGDAIAGRGRFHPP